jgi:hypothetical protein
VVWAGVDTQKDVLSIRINPLGPADHILSQKLLTNVSVDSFTIGNWLLAAKFQRPAAHSARIASFHSFTAASGPCDRLIAFSY